MTLAVVAIFLVLLLVDLPAVLRRRQPREIALYLVLSAITLACMVACARGAQVPSPIKALSELTQHRLGLDYAQWQGHS